jgi:hypothetical protein
MGQPSIRYQYKKIANDPLLQDFARLATAFASFVVGFPDFPITAITRCPDVLRPSACVPQPPPHPGVSLLLKTKAQPQFDRTVTDRSKPFFGRFTLSNRCHFPGLFTL